MQPRIKPPKNNQRLDANGRKDRAIGMDLDHIDSLLESTKAQGGRGFGDCWPYPLATDAKIKKDKRQRNIVERPSTPVVSSSRCHINVPSKDEPLSRLASLAVSDPTPFPAYRRPRFRCPPSGMRRPRCCSASCAAVLCRTLCMRARRGA